jgi:putative transposase
VSVSRAGRTHDGTIIPATVDTATTITDEGPTAVFSAIDHCSAKCVGIHADRYATRFQALEPVR